MIQEEISRIIINHLKKIDLEAGTHGLDSYGYYARPELKRPQTEVEWTKELCSCLNSEGYNANNEVKYPGDSQKRCDIVVTHEGEEYWIEVKGAWKDYWGNSKIYDSYMFNPLVPNLPDKGHSCVMDISDKLNNLPESYNKIFVLIGFDSEKHEMNSSVEKLEELLASILSSWYRMNAEWINPNVPNLRTKIWAYYSS